MDILGLKKNIISGIKNSIDGFKSILDIGEEKIPVFEDSQYTISE